MSDIININIGQAGLRIGDQFWQIISQQHGIGGEKVEGLPVFFEEKSKGWEARSIFIDTDQREIDKIKSRKGNIYNEFDFVVGKQSSRGLYPEAAHHVFPDMKDDVVDRARRKIQNCDNFGGFLVISSMNGGTGSGMGMRTLQALRQQYPQRMMQTIKIFPNINITNPLEIYNTANSVNSEVMNSDMSLIFDNAAVLRIMAREQFYRPTIDQQNRWIAGNIAQMTIPYRFSGSLNTNQRKIASNLVCFPRLHFFPFSMGNQHSINPLLSALKPQNLSLCNYYQQGGKIFNIYAGLHDHFANEEEIWRTVNNQMTRHQLKSIDWIQNIAHISIHQPVSRPSASVIVNSYNMKKYFNQVSDLFTKSFQRRGFYCWYSGCGLDSMEFTEIQSNLNDLASQYTPYEYYEDNQIYSHQSSQYAQ